MERKRIKLVVSVLICLAVAALAFAAVAYATGGQETAGEQIAHEVADEIQGELHEAGATGEPAHGEHGIPWGNFIGRVINLIIVLGLIWWLAGKKIGALFGGRRKQIAEDLDDLSKRKDNAEAKLKGVEKSIANLEQEKKAILEEANKQGEALKAAIIEKAEKDAEQMKAQAKRSAENEAVSAINTLRAEMADLVMEAAEKLVKEQLGDENHQKLVDESLTKVVLN